MRCAPVRYREVDWAEVTSDDATEARRIAGFRSIAIESRSARRTTSPPAGAGAAYSGRHGFLGGSRPVAAEGCGDEQVLKPVVVVAMAVEAFGRASPSLVGSRDRRVPGGVVRQQRPRSAVEPARLGRPVEVLPAIEVTVHPAHQAVQHVARPVAAGVGIGLGILLRSAAHLLDLLPEPHR